MANEAWYVAAKPWVGCPFLCQIVVVTKNGQEEAVRIFKEFYKNENLEPEAAVIIPIIKGELDPEA